MNTDAPRWGRIIRANDPSAARLLILFGANEVGVLSGAQYDLTVEPIAFAGKYRGMAGASPVSSLYALKFGGGC